MDEKLKEYPCVEIDGVLHITVSGSRCACGKKYEYADIDMANTIVVRSPLLWRTLQEVTCAMCLESAQK